MKLNDKEHKGGYNPLLICEMGSDNRIDIGINFLRVAKEIDDKARKIVFDWDFFREPSIMRSDLLGLGATYTDVRAFAPVKAKNIINLWKEGSEKLGLDCVAPLIALHEASALLYGGTTSVKPRWGEMITLLYSATKNSCMVRGYEKKISEIRRQLRGSSRFVNKSRNITDLERKLISFSTEALITSKLVDMGYSVEVPGTTPDLKIDGVLGEVKTVATPLKLDKDIVGKGVKPLEHTKLSEVISRAFERGARIAFIDLSHSSSGWIGVFLPESLTFENVVKKVMEIVDSNKRVAILTFHDGRNVYNLKALPVVL